MTQKTRPLSSFGLFVAVLLVFVVSILALTLLIELACEVLAKCGVSGLSCLGCVVYRVSSMYVISFLLLVLMGSIVIQRASESVCAFEDKADRKAGAIADVEGDAAIDATDAFALPEADGANADVNDPVLENAYEPKDPALALYEPQDNIEFVQRRLRERDAEIASMSDEHDETDGYMYTKANFLKLRTLRLYRTTLQMRLHILRASAVAPAKDDR